ncbi:hypothetical protein BROUX41_006021 [Berkeleyomyces rouxiae]
MDLRGMLNDNGGDRSSARQPAPPSQPPSAQQQMAPGPNGPQRPPPPPVDPHAGPVARPGFGYPQSQTPLTPSQAKPPHYAEYGPPHQSPVGHMPPQEYQSRHQPAYAPQQQPQQPHYPSSPYNARPPSLPMHATPQYDARPAAPPAHYRSASQPGPMDNYFPTQPGPPGPGHYPPQQQPTPAQQPPVHQHSQPPGQQQQPPPPPHHQQHPQHPHLLHHQQSQQQPPPPHGPGYRQGSYPNPPGPPVAIPAGAAHPQYAQRSPGLGPHTPSSAGPHGGPPPSQAHYPQHHRSQSNHSQAGTPTSAHSQHPPHYGFPQHGSPVATPNPGPPPPPAGYPRTMSQPTVSQNGPPPHDPRSASFSQHNSPHIGRMPPPGGPVPTPGHAPGPSSLSGYGNVPPPSLQQAHSHPQKPHSQSPVQPPHQQPTPVPQKRLSQTSQTSQSPLPQGHDQPQPPPPQSQSQPQPQSQPQKKQSQQDKYHQQNLRPDKSVPEQDSRHPSQPMLPVLPRQQGSPPRPPQDQLPRDSEPKQKMAPQQQAPLQAQVHNQAQNSLQSEPGQGCLPELTPSRTHDPSVNVADPQAHAHRRSHSQATDREEKKQLEESPKRPDVKPKANLVNPQPPSRSSSIPLPLPLPASAPNTTTASESQSPVVSSLPSTSPKREPVVSRRSVSKDSKTPIIENAVVPAKRKSDDNMTELDTIKRRDTKPTPDRRNSVNGTNPRKTARGDSISSINSPIMIKKRKTRHDHPPVWARKVSGKDTTIKHINFQLRKHPKPTGSLVSNSSNPAAATGRHASPDNARNPPSTTSQPQSTAAAATAPAPSAPAVFIKGWEPCMTGQKPLAEMPRAVADWIFLNVIQSTEGQEAVRNGGSIEVEAKLGVLIDKDTNERVQPFVATECLLQDNPRITFRSAMTEGQHQSFNNFLNDLTRKARAPRGRGPPRIPIDYQHLREVDKYFPLTPALAAYLPPVARTILSNQKLPPKIRITLDQNDQSKVLSKIVKIRVADKSLYFPCGPLDCRISINLEVNWDGPMDELETAISNASGNNMQRSKDRLSYSQGPYQIDLTQVTSTLGTRQPEKDHELEIELSSEAILEQGRRIFDNQPHSYPELIEGFLDNIRMLARWPVESQRR